MPRKQIPDEIILDDKVYVSIAKAAKIFGEARGKNTISPNRILYLINQKKLNAIRTKETSDAHFIAKEDVESYINKGLNNPYPGKKKPRLKVR